MYVFSRQYQQDRIYSINLDFDNFKEHAIIAANYWLTQRQGSMKIGKQIMHNNIY